LGDEVVQIPSDLDCNGYFETPEPSGWIPEPPGSGDFNLLTWEQPRTSGKNSEVPGKKNSRLSQLVDGSFVAGIIVVGKAAAFAHEQ
jgi:hypothetical protein